ncbi:MAG: DUF58 domain-containing protein [Clostridia bacterium]|nr:DUF58 domain-containing protein [Clostridia bacterium]
MFFIAFLIAMVAVYYLQRHVFFSDIFDRLDYSAELETREVYSGDDVYMYEEITSNRRLPIPYIKVNTELPRGLKFRLTERKNGDIKDNLMQNVQSVFVLHGKRKIRRRWRIACLKRGRYNVGSAIMVSGDIFGMKPVSKTMTADEGNVLTVLPSTVDLAEKFISSNLENGDILSNRRLLSEPYLRAGVRDYTAGDPMRKVNWKLSAAHGKLLVNMEEFTKKRSFNIFLNMNTREIERDPENLCDPTAIERCITVCSSIFEKVLPEGIPLRLISNGPPPSSDGETGLSNGDEVGEKLFFSKEYEGRGDLRDAQRMLAGIDLSLTVPYDKVLDHIASNPHHYCEGGGLVVVTPFIDERMLNFYRVMKSKGTETVFYVTATFGNSTYNTDECDVYFATDF